MGNGWEMVGIIQPMCSKPGHSWQGPFFSQKSAPFRKKCPFCCFYNKTLFFIIKLGGDDKYGKSPAPDSTQLGSASPVRVQTWRTIKQPQLPRGPKNKPEYANI